ncbi:uncharacterized protein LOC131889199 [Tigriopus californicus]|uniref:uncharacterized protein LOC131889199 n=1 Tax=Tigriopus californicus TaxID=6832 RepID=UPI0027DA55C3|nr:uncharacterized protein LOC131889199 [Tigriopus californicus]
MIKKTHGRLGGIMIISSILLWLCLFSIQGIQSSSSSSNEAGPIVTVPKGAGPEECFQYGLDIVGNDLNNGLNDKVNSAAECVVKCQGYPGAKYFTWSSAQLADPNYRLSCWCTPDNQGTTISANTISGPLDCGGSGGTCCDTLAFTSSGWIATSKPSHILGIYNKVGMGTNGRSIYFQQGGLGHYLYFLDSLQIWFIGDSVGSNVGYASNPGTAMCPEDIAATWDAWSPNANEWLLDPMAKMNCF